MVPVSCRMRVTQCSRKENTIREPDLCQLRIQFEEQNPLKWLNVYGHSVDVVLARLVGRGRYERVCYLI